MIDLSIENAIAGATIIALGVVEVALAPGPIEHCVILAAIKTAAPPLAVTYGQS